MNPNNIGNTPRIFYGWWVIAACGICMSTSPGQFIFGSLGLFIVPLSGEFGWDRAEISLALTLFTLSLAVSIPLLGQLVDRYGSKKVVIPSILIMAVGLVLITVVVSELWHLYILFVVLGCVTAGANNLPYLRTISVWFDKRRGLALGLAMIGNGFGYAYVPPLVQFAIDTGDWRAGYYALAAVCVFIAFPIAYFIIKDSPESMGLKPDGVTALSDTEVAPPIIGLTGQEAMKTRAFWILAAIFAIFSFSLFGLLPHIVPMLIDRGLEGADAARAAAVIGITIMGSRLIIGYLLDRVFGPYVALVCMLLAAVGLSFLAWGDPGVLAFFAAALIGIGIGAELDLLAYLVGRYFGLRYFGQIYGYLFAFFLLGSALGPYMYGLSFESNGSYVSILAICTFMTALAGLANLTLPKYPELEESK